METSQAQEIKSLQQKRDEEAHRVRDAAAKAKAAKDYADKISDLQKNHGVERQRMTERHSNDAEQVRRATQAPPEKRRMINSK